MPTLTAQQFAIALHASALLRDEKQAVLDILPTLDDKQRKKIFQELQKSSKNQEKIFQQGKTKVEKVILVGKMQAQKIS